MVASQLGGRDPVEAPARLLAEGRHNLRVAPLSGVVAKDQLVTQPLQ